MYKEAAEYQDESSLSDHISEPEDIISATDTAEDDDGDEGTLELDSDDIFEPTTRARAGAKNVNTATSSSSTRDRSSRNRKGETPIATPKTTRAGGSRVGQSSAKLASTSSSILTATAGVKRKSSGLRFDLGSTTLASASPSTESTASSSKKGSTPSSSRPKAQGSKSRKDNSAVASNDVQKDEPWAEKYAPTSIIDVAVHKGKIANVREWLDKYTVSGIIKRK